MLRSIPLRLPCLVGPLALAAVSCRSATEIRVEVTADPSLDCATVTTIIAVGTLDGVETKHPTATTRSCVGGHIGALVIVPSGDDNAEVALRVVTARGKDPDACGPGYAGCIVARRALRFLPHTSLTVSVPLRQSCLDKACLGDGQFSTCVDGQCVAATISDPGKCAGSGCDEASLGGAAVDAGGPDAAPGGGDASADGDTGTTRPPAAWVPMAAASTVGLLPRSDATGVWTGSQMLVWGGAVDFGYASDGATYDPVADRWALLPSTQLTARSHHTMVWSGTEAILWGGGGGRSDGAKYDPVKGLWAILEPVPARTAGRIGHVAVWSTKTFEMIIWGGQSSSGTNLGDGAAYAPATGTWRVIADSAPFAPRDRAAAVWNGSRMIVFGGVGCGSYCGDAAAYDPKADKWSAIAPPPALLDARASSSALATGPSGALATFFGGGLRGLDSGRTTGATYDASANTWTPIDGLGTALLPDPGRYDAASWWGDGRLWRWGGYATGSGDVARDDGAVYDPATKAWARMPAGGPSRRAAAVTVWTGTEAIVWSGETAAVVPDGAPPTTLLLDDGKRFRP